MDTNNIFSCLDDKEYNFLHTNEHLHGKIAFLCLGGSYAYGTNIATSDVDIRGCALNSVSDLLGMTNFENFIDKETDTTVYSFNKLVRLLYGCNPNVIEMLGCKPEHYTMMTPAGETLIANRGLFLSQRAAYTFGGYAFSQLRRLENAIARDKLPQDKKETHIRNSIDKVIRNFNGESGMEPVSYTLSVGSSAKEDLETETKITMSLSQYPVRNLKALINDINNVINDYQNDLHGRNKKKDDLHLNKHAMHLVRLYLMCLDILEQEEIVTYREKEHDLLMDIRTGKFQCPDGTFDSAFFDLVDDLSKRMEYAKQNTSLPKTPDMKKIEELTIYINSASIGLIKE